MPAKDPTTSTEEGQPVSGVHYKVLARRWRPQQFTDLVGQEAIAQALQGAIKAERVAHAYLFTGARGVGKTTTARILAKALNCVTGPTCSPCGQCDSCEGITSGDDVDVIEIDGASNRGIDEVRELRQNANLRPTRGRYKIYIIDEVHMLTREAFNALLKTLEEPPEHVKFFFATTDPQKIPITILSRCQRFDFGTISESRIRNRLEEIIKTEVIAVDGEVLDLLARRAAGSMRDALSLMDQLLAFGGDRVTVDQVHRLLGTASDERLLQLIASLLDRDAGRAITVVDEAEAQGVQLGELVDQLIEYFRDLMVAKSAGAEARLVSVAAQQRDRIVEQAGRLSLDFMFAATDILAQAKARLRGTTQGRILLDVALARIASLEDLGSLEDLARRLAELEGQLGQSPAHAAGPSVARSPVAVEPKKKERLREPDGGATSRQPQPSGPLTPGPQPAEAAPAPYPIAKPESLDAATQLLREVTAELGPVLQESLTRAQLAWSSDRDVLVITLDPMYNTAGGAKDIENGLKARLGSALKIRVDVGVGEQPAALTPSRRSSYSERLASATRDPLVQQAINVFGARVVRVDED